ncbi:MAG: hypothetical protein OEZ68_13040 [Gammaproteobacteria bacterium]|nr:hypothetical protein [Gammaproteobacteria bacterium]MDH5801724.1 hypothetical protein [Gammaproteobacteria bacterium]
MRYTSGNLSGTTDANGTYNYVDGNTVQFFVGDILIGESLGQDIITPLDLAGEPANLSNPAAINIARFLQTLDDDGNPDNGIIIPDAISQNASGDINFNQSLSVFENDSNVEATLTELASLTTAISPDLKPALDAAMHLTLSLLYKEEIKRITIQVYSSTSNILCDLVNARFKYDRDAFEAYKEKYSPT